MSRLRSLAPSGWVTVGLIIGAIILPTAALAAFSDVRIVGTNGTTQAQVTPANQLRVATTDPFRYRQFNSSFGNGCTTIGTVNSGTGFILKQATFDVYNDTTPGSSVFYVYAGAGCSGPIIVDVTRPATGWCRSPSTPGSPCPPAPRSRSSRVASAHTFLLGYTTPTSAVPSITQTNPSGSFARRARARRAKH